MKQKFSLILILILVLVLVLGIHTQSFASQEKYFVVTDIKTEVTIHSKDTAVFSNTINAPKSIFREGQEWILVDENSKMQLKNITWTGPIKETVTKTPSWAYAANNKSLLMANTPRIFSDNEIKNYYGSSAKYVPGTIKWNSNIEYAGDNGMYVGLYGLDSPQYHMGKDYPAGYKYKRTITFDITQDVYTGKAMYEGNVRYKSTNSTPELKIIEPMTNHRIGNQDSLIVNGQVLDEDLADVLKIKYDLDTIKAKEITLTQPINLISNGQWQSFKGNIQLNGLNSGSSILKLYAEDDKGDKSNVIEIPIITFNTLENVFNSLKSYTYKAGEPQFLVINSNTRIMQSTDNDRLINLIKTELNNKNVKLFFIGQGKETEQYIKSNLFLD